MEAIFLRCYLMLPSPCRIQTYEIEVHYTLRSAFSKLRLPKKWAISSASGKYNSHFFFIFYFLVMTFVCILCSTVFQISGLRIYWIKNVQQIIITSSSSSWVNVYRQPGLRWPLPQFKLDPLTWGPAHALANTLSKLSPSRNPFQMLVTIAEDQRRTVCTEILWEFIFAEERYFLNLCILR